MSATLKPDLRSRIAGLSAVTSAGFSAYIDRMPQFQDEYKSIVIKRVGYDPHATLAADDDTMITETFSVETRGKDSMTAEAINDAIVDDMQALQGVNVGASRTVMAVSVDDQTDGHEFDDFGGDAGNGMVTSTFTIMHIPQ